MKIKKEIFRYNPPSAGRRMMANSKVRKFDKEKNDEPEILEMSIEELRQLIKKELG